MNVLVIGHAYITPINQTKWTELARLHPNINITVITPLEWQTSFFLVQNATPFQNNQKNCQFIGVKTYLTGNEQLYFYTPFSLAKIFWKTKPDVIHVEIGRAHV